MPILILILIWVKTPVLLELLVWVILILIGVRIQVPFSHRSKLDSSKGGKGAASLSNFHKSGPEIDGLGINRRVISDKIKVRGKIRDELEDRPFCKTVNFKSSQPFGLFSFNLILDRSI